MGQTSALAELHLHRTETTVRSVEVVTLDSEWLDTDLAIDLLKVDVEGFDMRVLRGAAGLLGADRIRCVQFEYNHPWVLAGSSLYEALTYLGSFGFECFLIRSSGLHPINYELYGDYFRYSNFLCVKSEFRGAVEPLLGPRW